MAALKHFAGDGGVPAVEVLHGVTAVAALKLVTVAGGEVLEPRHVLHGVTAVAALKLGQRADQADALGTFSTASLPWPH